jgi:hypothetical protein
VEAQSISAWRSQKVQELSAAQYNGNAEAVARLIDELRAVHVLLAHRETGTREEQNTYLLARATGTPMPELAAVGIDTNSWPAPPSSPTTFQSQHASPATEDRISRILGAAGPLSDRQPPPDRYRVEHRPQDNKRYHGIAQPWAMVDRQTGLPVAYFAEREEGEWQAEQASELFASSRGSRGG